MVAAACVLLVTLTALDPAAWRNALYLTLVLLVTSCPCALVISTPVASAAGLARAAGQGVLIKGGRFLELLGQVSSPPPPFPPLPPPPPLCRPRSLTAFPLRAVPFPARVRSLLLPLSSGACRCPAGPRLPR